MLIRLLPPSPTPTVLFTLSAPPLPPHLPLPIGYTHALAALSSNAFDAPPSLHALDSASWPLALLEEVVFDMSAGGDGGGVRVKWCDGIIEEWAFGSGSMLEGRLEEVVRVVREAAVMAAKEMKESSPEPVPIQIQLQTPVKDMKEKEKKRKNLIMNLVASVLSPSTSLNPSPPPTDPPPSPPPIRAPTPIIATPTPPTTTPMAKTRLLRRRARSLLLDAFRIHVVNVLASRSRSPQLSSRPTPLITSAALALSAVENNGRLRGGYLGFCIASLRRKLAERVLEIQYMHQHPPTPSTPPLAISISVDVDVEVEVDAAPSLSASTSSDDSEESEAGPRTPSPTEESQSSLPFPTKAEVLEEPETEKEEIETEEEEYDALLQLEDRLRAAEERLYEGYATPVVIIGAGREKAGNGRGSPLRCCSTFGEEEEGEEFPNPHDPSSLPLPSSPPPKKSTTTTYTYSPLARTVLLRLAFSPSPSSSYPPTSAGLYSRSMCPTPGPIARRFLSGDLPISVGPGHGMLEEDTEELEVEGWGVGNDALWGSSSDSEEEEETEVFTERMNGLDPFTLPPYASIEHEHEGVEPWEAELGLRAEGGKMRRMGSEILRGRMGMVGVRVVP